MWTFHIDPLRTSHDLASPIVRTNEVVHPRADLLPPLPAVEDAVVADGLLLVMHPHRRRQGRAEVVGGAGMAPAGDVVVLTLDRHQGRAPDRGGLDPPAAGCPLDARPAVPLEQH